MIRTSIGIDTSILVRLVAHEPEDLYQQCVGALRNLIEDRGFMVYASNQVEGEAYAVLRHHYGASTFDATTGLLRAFDSGLVAPLNGQAVLDALSAYGGPGLFDRIIANDYSRAGLETLTLDQPDGLPARRAAPLRYL